MKSNKRLFTGFVLLAALMVACACPASLPGLNSLKGVEETGKAIASQLPQGLAETAEAYATEVDVSPQEIAKTAEAGMATFIPETTGEPPKDIPIIEGDVSMQIVTPEMVSYTAKQSPEDVKNFYQGQMLAYGWKLEENDGIQIPGTTVLSYENEEKRANVTIIGLGETTQVLIEVSAK
jgi:hypothetical protein